MDYHRLNRPSTRPLIAELVDEGRLVETTVAGWAEPALMHPTRTSRAGYVPARCSARSTRWSGIRDRAERLFGFRYRIEIYVPKPKRVYGYYVLPFLLGDDLVARVDLKADREHGPAARAGRIRRAGGPERGRGRRIAVRTRRDGGVAGARCRRRVAPTGDLLAGTGCDMNESTDPRPSDHPGARSGRRTRRYRRWMFVRR